MSHALRIGRRRILVLLLAAACLPAAVLPVAPAAAQDGFRIIVHPSNAASSLSADQASRLFLKKVRKWDDRTSVQPVDQAPSSAVREEFSQQVHGRSAGAIKAYWQQRIFSGRDVPPPELASDREVLAYVRSNPGAVGYVSAGAALSGVKALDVR